MEIPDLILVTEIHSNEEGEKIELSELGRDQMYDLRTENTSAKTIYYNISREEAGTLLNARKPEYKLEAFICPSKIKQK